MAPVRIWQAHFVSIVLGLAFSSIAPAANLTWIGGNVDWVDASGATNWNPNDEPDADDTAIFNSANTVNLGSNNSVLGLTMSGGMDVHTNEFELVVDGLVQLTGSSTFLFVDGAAGKLNADDLTINADGTVELGGGTLTLDEEVGTSLLDINADGALGGHGTITFADTPVAATTLLTNDGTLTAFSRGLTIFSPPPVGTLQINDSSIGGRVDLDGLGEAGVVNINRHQTLDLNVPLADAFGGTMNLSHNSTLDVSSAWTLNAGTLNANNGFVDGSIPFPDVPADKSYIKGGTLTQTGGTINVDDDDGTLQFDTSFVMSGGNFVNNGHVIFNNNATINNPAVFTMGNNGTDLTVGANANVSITQTSFNLDGNTAGTVITVNEGAMLELILGDYDNDAVTNAFDATVTLNGGGLQVSTADAEFVMDGVLNMHSAASGNAFWTDEPLDIGNDAGVLDADVNVTGDGLAAASFGAPVDFNSDADVNIAAGGELLFATTATVNFDTVNGGNHAEFTGAGKMTFNGTVNVNEAVTLNLVGGTVDLDGADATGEFINVDAPLTINAATMSSFGKVNGGGGTNTLDVNNSVGTGVLTVNLDDANDEWTLNAAAVMNLVNDSVPATLLAGSDVNMNGTVNVTGTVRTTARVDVGSTGHVNIIVIGEHFRLAGGSLADPNTISGGTMGGLGFLSADTDKSLQGFGTLNSIIDFDGTATLLADNGTLTLNQTIFDVGTIGTADVDGTLNVVPAWDNAASAGVQLKGGTLSGGAITNNVAAGISGHGLVTARVINNTQLFASLGDKLVFQTAGNDNDWDGTTNTGEIEAVSANIELRDVGPAQGFTGTVRASNNHTAFANGFALDFNPGSTLNLLNGGTYKATSSTDLGGTVAVGAGGATIEVENNVFLTFESTSVTSLGSNLQLKNNNINIEAGATFSGAGALVIPDGSHMVADNLANIGVLLDMQGAFRPGNFEGIGRVDMFDYQQSNTGDLYVELRGTALNAFDRLVLSGDAVVDGYLNIDIDEISPGVPFVPTLGQTFNIITGNTVTGQFDFYDVSGMPAGLAFSVNYLANAVQLQVVNKESFAADFDDDGDVDLTDYAIWRGAFHLNQLGDATGDNISDAADYTVWRDQLGSISGAGAGSGGFGFAAVPEPGTAVLLIVAGMAAICGTRRRISE